jgi:autotransporter translocation and assembly factor TamB
MAASRSVRRVGRFLLGFVLGVVLVALVLFVWLESARTDRLGRMAFERVPLPPEVLRLESVSPAGVLRVSARNVVLLDPAGDTVAAVPRLVFSIDPETISDDGPFVLSDAVLERPLLNLVEYPDGTRNLDRVTRVTVDGREVETEPGRAIVFDGVRIDGGRVRWVTPWDGEPMPASGVQLVRLGDGAGRVRTVQGLDARLPLVRFGGGEPWRVEVASATARLTDPDVRLAALQGVVEEAPDDGIRFDIGVLRTDASQLAGEGVVRFGDDGPRFDVRLRAAPLAFSDLRWFAPQLPAEGAAQGAFAIRTLAGDRTDVVATDLVVTAFGSRVEGRVGVEFGGEQPVVFRDTRLLLDPLDLATLEQLGVVDTLPYVGEVRGVLATVGPAELEAGALRVDLRATLTPRGLDVPASVITAQGGLGLGGPSQASFQSLRVSLEPLYLAALRPLAPEQAERLVGVVRGDVVLTGTPEALRLAQGGLTYELPGAEPILLAGIEGELVLQPELRFDIGADTRLPLATLAALAPGLPFEAGFLTGPVRVRGTPEDIGFDVDLDGTAGGIAMQGRLLPGTEPLRFEVTGRLNAFRPGALLAADLPVEGPISGTFALRGTTQYFTYDVDLQQELGRFALQGWVRDPTGDLAVEARGRVSDFRLGTLIGQPALFPAPVSGDIWVRGGAGQAINFDVGLAGPGSEFDVRGWVLPGDVPRFAVSGRVQGLDLRPLGGVTGAPLPGPISGTFALDGTTQFFNFDVDLQQELGRFALQGWVRDPTGDVELQVAGDVTNFQIGTLIGQPTLLPSPVTGRIDVRGGARRPIEFDVDLTGAGAALVLRGWAVPGEIPRFAAAGHVRGLDLRRLPGAGALPPTVLAADLTVEGRGSSLANFEGRLDLTGRPGTTFVGYPVQSLVARLALADGVLTVDTVGAALAGARLSAAGVWGLTREVPGELQIAFVAQDLERLAPMAGRLQVLPPLLSGSVALNARVTGTLEQPVVQANLSGRNLRYEGWRAATLVAAVDGRLGGPPEQWQGTLSVSATNAQVRPDLVLQRLDFEANAAAGVIALGLSARRDAQADVQLAGTLELDGRTPRGLLLDQLALRLDGAEWQLDQPSAIRFTQEEGVLVQDLSLRRTDGPEGLIAIDGRLPSEGEASLRVQVVEFDLEMVRRLYPAAPAIAGVLNLEALVDGPVGTPEVLITARAENLRVDATTADLVLLNARYTDRMLVVDTATIWLDGVPVAVAQGQIPMSLSLAGLSPQFELLDAGPIQGLAVLDSLPLGLVVAAIPNVSAGEGIVTGEVRMAGTVGSPELSGEAQVIRGALTIDPLRVRYSEIGGRFAFQNNEIRFDSLGMRSGGAVVASGSIQPSGDGTLVYLTADFRSFRAADLEDYSRVTLTGRAALSGRFPAPVLSGEIRVDEANVRLPNFGDGSPVELVDFDVGQLGADTIGTPILGPAFLQQLRVEGLVASFGDNVWVQNNELRAQLTADDIIVYRDATALRIFGDINTTRGTYRLQIGPLTREFDVVTGRIRFLGTPDFNAELDILASYDVRAGGVRDGGGVLTVLVQVSGTVESPRIELTSNTQPPLPQSELLSYLVFGRPTFELGPEGAVGLAQQVIVGEIAGGLVLMQLENLLLARGLPCDQLRVRGRPELADPTSPFGATTIECSVQILPRLFWTIEAGVGVVFGDPLVWATSLVWQIRPELTASLAIEPVRPEFFGRRTFINSEITSQVTTELRRVWEFGRPPAQQLDIEGVPGRMPGQVAPTPVREPTAPPLPPDPDPASPEAAMGGIPRPEE